jgi:hypothetical protein
VEGLHHVGHLEDPPERPGRADDGESLAAPGEPPVRVDQEGEPGRIHEVDVAEVHDERPERVLNGAVQDADQARGGRDVELSLDQHQFDALVGRALDGKRLHGGREPIRFCR